MGAGDHADRPLDQFAGEPAAASSRGSARSYIARNRDIGALWNEGERTLIHGDDHIGNLFVDPGRTGFVDVVEEDLADARPSLGPAGAEVDQPAVVGVEQLARRRS